MAGAPATPSLCLAQTVGGWEFTPALVSSAEQRENPAQTPDGFPRTCPLFVPVGEEPRVGFPFC